MSTALTIDAGLNQAGVLHGWSTRASLPSHRPPNRTLSPMVTQVGVYSQALPPTGESSISEHGAVFQEPCGRRNLGRILDGQKATVSTGVRDPLSSPPVKPGSNLPPKQPPNAAKPDLTEVQEDDETSKTEIRPSQETPPAVGIHSLLDPIESVWDYSVPVPGSRRKKHIYPKAPVEFGSWSQEQCHARILFVKNELEALVDKYLDLHGLERRPVYTPRMVGTAPSTAFPSIVITCRKDDAKALQDLFRSRAELRLCVGKGSTLSQLRSSLGKDKDENESIPRLRLVYYRIQTSTVNRRASDETLEAYVDSSGAYCGGLIQYQHASATLGPSIEIDGMNVVLTVDHLFPSNASPDLPLGDDDLPISGGSEGSNALTLNNDDLESMDALWEDDGEYDDLDEDELLSLGGTEVKLPPEQRIPGRGGPGKDKATSLDPQQWERVVPPGNPNPSSPYLDWALTRPICRQLACPSFTNIIFPDGPDGRHITLDQIRRQPPSHLASVYMVSGVRGIVYGKILFGSSFLPSFPGQDYCEAWTIILDNSEGLANGECGSIVIDRVTSEVYGHVVGSNSLGHAYVVPLTKVLEQVKECFNGKHAGLTWVTKANEIGKEPQHSCPDLLVLTKENGDSAWREQQSLPLEFSNKKDGAYDRLTSEKRPVIVVRSEVDKTPSSGLSDHDRVRATTPTHKSAGKKTRTRHRKGPRSRYNNSQTSAMSSEDSYALLSGRGSSGGNFSEHAQSDGVHTAMTSIMDLDENHLVEADFEDEEDIDITSIYPRMHHSTGSHLSEMHFSQEHPYPPSSDADVSTRSLWDQGLDYRGLYGRRYCREYYMPNDEIEQLRLSLQHQVFMYILNGDLTQAPIQDPTQILDIGTGTGEWAIKMAELYPQCVVVGTDISAIAETRDVPLNVFFEIEDAEDWDRFPHMYDLIHFRSMEGSFQNWSFMYDNAFYSLKPGGWIEVQDFGPADGSLNFVDQFPPNSPIHTINQDLLKAAAKSGRPRGTGHLDPRLFMEAGFVNVQVMECIIPITVAEESAGKIWLISCLDALEANCLRLLVEQMGWDSEKCKAACEQAARELANLAKDPEKSRGLKIKMRTVIGMKPVETRPASIIQTLARSSSPAATLANEGSSNPTLHPGDEDTVSEISILSTEAAGVGPV